MRNPHRKPAGPSPSLRYEYSILETARQTIRDTYSGVTADKNFPETVAGLARLADEMTAKYKVGEPPASSIHCRAGCGHCCHMRVHATAPEILFLAQFIRDTFSEADLKVLRSRLADANEITGGMGDEEHGKAGVPCALLVDDRCSVYKARPLECRGYVSMNVVACREASTNYDAWNVPLYYPQYSIFKNVQIALLLELIDAGYDFELLELTAALRIALATPDAAERWMGGEDVFGAAALPETDPEVSALRPWTPTFEVSEAPAMGRE